MIILKKPVYQGYMQNDFLDKQNILNELMGQLESAKLPRMHVLAT